MFEGRAEAEAKHSKAVNADTLLLLKGKKQKRKKDKWRQQVLKASIGWTIVVIVNSWGQEFFSSGGELLRPKDRIVIGETTITVCNKLMVR